MNPIPLSTNKYVQIVLIVAILIVLYKLLNSDLFKGVGKGAEGVGSAVQGIGSSVGSVASETGKVINTYLGIVNAFGEKLGTWTGIVDDPKDKPFLDLYENLPWSQTSLYNKPFFMPSKVVNKGFEQQTYNWIGQNVSKPIAESGGFGSYDEQKIFGAIDKLATWIDFMRLAERFKPMTNKSLRAYLDNALTNHEKAELGRIMNSKPLYKPL